MTQFLTPRRRQAGCATALWLAGCAAPPVVAPPPPATIEAPATAPGSTARASTAYQWTDKLAGAAQRLRGNLQGGDVSVSQTTELRLWVSLPADQVFAAGRSAVMPPARTWLDQIAVALREVPRAEVQIVSDADGANSTSTRVQALDRAASARDWLVSRGVPAQRIGVAGRSAPAAGGADSPRLDILIGERSRAAP